VKVTVRGWMWVGEGVGEAEAVGMWVGESNIIHRPSPTHPGSFETFLDCTKRVNTEKISKYR
jgi:hypothetical protein